MLGTTGRDRDLRKTIRRHAGGEAKTLKRDEAWQIHTSLKDGTPVQEDHLVR
jgi:hypothetical protein